MTVKVSVEAPQTASYWEIFRMETLTLCTSNPYSTFYQAYIPVEQQVRLSKYGHVMLLRGIIVLSQSPLQVR